MLPQRTKTPRGLRGRGLVPKMQGAGWRALPWKKDQLGCLVGAGEIPQSLARGEPIRHPAKGLQPLAPNFYINTFDFYLGIPCCKVP